MAAQTQKNVNIAALLGDQGTKAFEANRDIPLMGKNERLPAGIDNGIAQLKKIWVGQYKDGPDKGKPFYMASGVVLLPEVHEGIPIKGRHTQVGPEPLFPTPTKGGKRKTYEDHYAWMMNELMLLNPALEKNRDAMKPANLQATFDALIRAGIPFRFRTYKFAKQVPEQKGSQWFLGTKGPYPSEAALKAANKYWNSEPMVNEEWLGACAKPMTVQPGQLPEEVGVIDEIGTDDATTSAATADYDQAEAAGVPTEPAVDEVAGQELETQTSGSSDDGGDAGAVATAPGNPEDDIPALVEAAGADDDLAKARLEELAVALGYSSDDVANAPSWNDVGEWIITQTPAPEAAVEPEPEPEPAPPPPPVKVAVKATPAAKPTTTTVKAPAGPKPPKVGDSGFSYQFKDTKGAPLLDKMKKPVKPVSVEVLSVNPTLKTVTLQNLTTGQPILGADKKPANIKWTDLLQ